MSRINKRLLALLLLLVIPFSAAYGSELITPDKIVTDDVNYDTCQSFYGNLYKTATMGANEYYPVYTTVVYEGSTATFVENLARTGDMVKKGDPLMRVKVEYDQVEMTRLQLNYTRSMEAFEQGKADRQNQIEQLERNCMLAGDDYSRRMAELQLQKAEIQLDQYIFNQQSALTGQLEYIEELKKIHAMDIIYAPCDGEVADMSYMQVGDRVNTNTFICNIYDMNVKMLAVLSNTELRYGMDVIIETGANKNRIEFEGKVVAAADSLPDEESTVALVEIIGFDPNDDVNWRNIKITTDVLDIQNVLLMNRKAYVLNGGKYVVTKLRENGITQKRYVNPGLMDSSNLWVLQGLEAGDTIILD